LQSVAFSGSGDETIYRDDGGGAYQGAQWYDTNMNGTIDSSAPKYSNGTIDDQLLGPPPAGTVYEHDYPVAYARSTTTSPDYVTATPSFVFNGTAGPGWEIEGSDSGDGLTFPATAVGAGGAGLSAAITSTQALPTTITSTTMAIDWKLSTDGGKAWQDLGASKNHLYVTGADTNALALVNTYETVVDLGCTAANGQTPPAQPEVLPASLPQVQAITNRIWGAFTGRKVYRVEDPSNPMTYWGKHAGPGSTATDLFSTLGLLTNGDGRCNAWADFLDDVLQVQGVQAHEVDVVIVPSTINLPNDTAPTNATGRVGIVMDVNKPAQGNPTPWRYFPNHALVRIDGITGLYDPSYGTNKLGANADQQWQDAAISGFCNEYTVLFGGVTSLAVGSAYMTKVSGQNNVDIGQ